MKCPTLIKAIEQDLAAQNAVVVQIVSTNEELLKRRLDEVPASEWQDLGERRFISSIARRLDSLGALILNLGLFLNKRVSG